MRPGVGSALILAGVLAASAAGAAPDLTGVWSNTSLTKLTRAPGATSVVMTEDEAQKLAAGQLARVEADNRPTDPNAPAPEAGAVGGYNQFWGDNGDGFARVGGTYRSSWIVEPASGQLPLNAAGRAMMAEAVRRPNDPPDGPEAMAPADRCLIGSRGSGGPGMLNNIYNNTYQFVQTKDSIVIVIEMMHDARIVRIFPTKAAAQAGHAPAAVRRWLGDSTGWWEGDVLMVETVHMHPEQGRNAPYLLSETARVTETFRKLSDREIAYGFQVDDPTYYSQPWRTEMVFRAVKGPVYEYACHEGNYAIHGILAGARAAEGKAVEGN